MAAASATGPQLRLALVPLKRREHRVHPHRRFTEDAETPVPAGVPRTHHVPPLHPLPHRWHHHDRLRLRQHQSLAGSAAAYADRWSCLSCRHGCHVARWAHLLSAVERRAAEAEASDGAADASPAACPSDGPTQETCGAIAKGAAGSQTP